MRCEDWLLLGGFGGDDEGLDAGVEAGLVAAGGVLMQDTLLDALVEDGDGLAVGGGDGLLVAFGDGLAQVRRVPRSLVLLARLPAVLVTV